LKLAAVDIGSNAARLLITEVLQDESGNAVFNKMNLVRVPLRLGFDVFEQGYISKQRLGMMLQTMKAFKHLCNAYEVIHIKACATSAMRDAKNSEDIIRKVRLETEIPIEIISGDLEAGLIYENHVAESMDKDHSYLYIDVGGGSTELSFFSNNILIYKKSFNIGTIRLLKNMVTDKEWDEMKETIRAVTKGHKKVVAIGSGGNINKVFSMSKRKDGKPLSLELLRDYYKELSSVTLTDRIVKYSLREDRADVIVPAILIYINTMRWANAEEIYVPKIGLADGLIRHLWEEVKTGALQKPIS
jgi:exopolyphosphatase / guanosine-5'-triphosphate,3'-diphosphate pyrophosphatase